MKDIEVFFKDNLKGKAVEPPQAMWQKISQAPELVHYNKTHRIKRLAVRSFGGVAVAVVVATVLWLSWPAQDKNAASQTETNTANSVLQPANEPVATNPPAEPAITIDNPKEDNASTAFTPVVPIVTIPANSQGATPANQATPTPNATTATPKSPNSVPKTEPAVASNNSTTQNKPADKPATATNSALLSSAKNSSATLPEEEEQSPMEAYELFMPNAFSPNGDGINDLYELSAAFAIDNFSLCIYDRKGQLVFKSTDITHAWTGEMNGKMLPAGTYAYLVKYIDEFNRIHQKKGNILLIR